MRIAINGRMLISNKLEGIGYFTWEVLKKMVIFYPDHNYLLLFDRKPAKEFLITGVEYKVVLPSARHPVLYRLWFDVLVPQALRRWKADIFLSFDGFTSQFLSIPTITAIHDLAYLHLPHYMKSSDLQYYQKYQPRFAQISTRILTVSKFSAKDIADQYGISDQKIKVVYNGSRFEKTHPKDDPAILKNYGLIPSQYFLYTGSLHPRKNITRLVEAFEQTNAASVHGVKLVLAGRQAWKTAELTNRIKISPFSEEIILTGYIPDEVLWNLLKNALGLCYISLFEGFGVPVLDAFHAQTAVICSSTTSLSEVAGDAALQVDPEDVGAIATAMDQLYDESDLRLDLIKRGNRRRYEYNWSLTTRLILQAMKEAYKEG